MKKFEIARPNDDEYDAYYKNYVALVADGDIVETLSNQIAETRRVLVEIDSEKAGFRYASGKWSVRELVGHMIDAERIFAYRALRIARGDATPIEGYEQNDYVENAAFDNLNLADLTEEFVLLRRANVLMYRGLQEAAWARRGVANGCEVTVRALAYLSAGHELYHLNILRSRYLMR